MSRLASIAFFGMLMATAGCSRQCPLPDSAPIDPAPPVVAADSVSTAEATAPEGTDPTLDAISLRVVDEHELAEVIAGHRGSVVLVDFWATWCLECVRLFPHTVALHEHFADRGLVVLSVSFDQPDAADSVLQFLRGRNARFEHFLSRYGASVDSGERFGLSGPLPQVVLYDRDGTLVATFPAPQSAVDPEAIEQAIERVLASDVSVTEEDAAP